MELKKKVPEVRFKGFSGEWEEVELQSGATKIGDGLHGTPNYVVDGGVFFINGNNLISGKIFISNETKQVSINEQSKDDKALNDNTILMSINGTIGNLAYYQEEKVMLSKSVAYITPAKRDKTYIFTYLQIPRIHAHFNNNLTGSTIKNLGLRTIRETNIFIPKNTIEQSRIGTWFQHLDQLISLHQKKYNKLTNIKKAMLEKMFPKNGSDVPEIRFEGFEGKWEEKRLGEISPLRGGFAFQSNQYCEEGIPIIKISNILATGEIGGEFDHYKEQEKDENYTLPNYSALLAMSGATTGKVSILKKENNIKVYQNQRVGYFVNKGIVDYLFISTILRSNLFAKKLSSVLVAGAQPNVSSKEIDSFEFSIPISIAEQQKIGTYFQKLDQLITLQQTQIEKLQNIKKACLEKMFV